MTTRVREGSWQFSPNFVTTLLCDCGQVTTLCAAPISHLTHLGFRSPSGTLNSSAVSKPKLLLSHLSSNMNYGSQSCCPRPGQALGRVRPVAAGSPPALLLRVSEPRRGNTLEACSLLASVQRGQQVQVRPFTLQEGQEKLQPGSALCLQRCPGKLCLPGPFSIGRRVVR